jgi:3-oxoacyl-[acyl-carrier protein] reductase
MRHLIGGDIRPCRRHHPGPREEDDPERSINAGTIQNTIQMSRLAAGAAAKAGVINYTKTAALELAPHRIRVNALAPDIVLTEGLAALAPDGVADIGRDVPLGRPGHVDEIASAAVFLASDMAGYITGQTIHVDGGWYRDPRKGEYWLGPA